MSTENKGNTDNTFTYENATLQIENKSVSSEDYVMQISSISQARIGKLPKKKPSALAVIIILVFAGFLFFMSTFYYGNTRIAYIIFGFLTLAMLVIYLIFLSQEIQQYGLSIELNSGRSMFFVSDNQSFLRKVLSIIHQRMEDSNPSQEIYVAHFEKGAIDQRTQKVKVNDNGTVIMDSNVTHNPFIDRM